MPLSSSNALLIPATLIGTIFLCFGINALISPTRSPHHLRVLTPASAADAQLVDAFLALYGVRDIFMGAAIYAAAYFGSRKCLGWILMSASVVAAEIVKGLIGKGEWNHWGMHLWWQ